MFAGLNCNICLPFQIVRNQTLSRSKKTNLNVDAKTQKSSRQERKESRTQERCQVENKTQEELHKKDILTVTLVACTSPRLSQNTVDVNIVTNNATNANLNCPEIDGMLHNLTKNVVLIQKNILRQTGEHQPEVIELFRHEKVGNDSTRSCNQNESSSRNKLEKRSKKTGRLKNASKQMRKVSRSESHVVMTSHCDDINLNSSHETETADNRKCETKSSSENALEYCCCFNCGLDDLDKDVAINEEISQTEKSLSVSEFCCCNHRGSSVVSSETNFSHQGAVAMSDDSRPTIVKKLRRENSYKRRKHNKREKRTNSQAISKICVEKLPHQNKSRPNRNCGTFDVMKEDSIGLPVLLSHSRLFVNNTNKTCKKLLFSGIDSYREATDTESEALERDEKTNNNIVQTQRNNAIPSVDANHSVDDSHIDQPQYQNKSIHSDHQDPFIAITQQIVASNVGSRKNINIGYPFKNVDNHTVICTAKCDSSNSERNMEDKIVPFNVDSSKNINVGKPFNNVDNHTVMYTSKCDLSDSERNYEDKIVTSDVDSRRNINIGNPFNNVDNHTVIYTSKCDLSDSERIDEDIAEDKTVDLKKKHEYLKRVFLCRCSPKALETKKKSEYYERMMKCKCNRREESERQSAYLDRYIDCGCPDKSEERKKKIEYLEKYFGCDCRPGRTSGRSCDCSEAHDDTAVLQTRLDSGNPFEDLQPLQINVERNVALSDSFVDVDRTELVVEVQTSERDGASTTQLDIVTDTGEIGATEKRRAHVSKKERKNIKNNRTKKKKKSPSLKSNSWESVDLESPETFPISICFCRKCEATTCTCGCQHDKMIQENSVVIRPGNETNSRMAEIETNVDLTEVKNVNVIPELPPTIVAAINNVRSSSSVNIARSSSESESLHLCLSDHQSIQYDLLESPIYCGTGTIKKGENEMSENCVETIAGASNLPHVSFSESNDPDIMRVSSSESFVYRTESYTVKIYSKSSDLSSPQDDFKSNLLDTVGTVPSDGKEERQKRSNVVESSVECIKSITSLMERSNTAIKCETVTSVPIVKNVIHEEDFEHEKTYNLVTNKKHKPRKCNMEADTRKECSKTKSSINKPDIESTKSSIPSTPSAKISEETQNSVFILDALYQSNGRDEISCDLGSFRRKRWNSDDSIDSGLLIEALLSPSRSVDDMQLLMFNTNNSSASENSMNYSKCDDCGLLLDPISPEELMYSDSNLKIEVGTSIDDTHLFMFHTNNCITSKNRINYSKCDDCGLLLDHIPSKELMYSDSTLKIEVGASIDDNHLFTFHTNNCSSSKNSMNYSKCDDCGLLLDPISPEELMYSNSNLKIEVGASVDDKHLFTYHVNNNCGSSENSINYSKCDDCGLLLDHIPSKELMYSDSNLKIEVGASIDDNHLFMYHVNNHCGSSENSINYSKCDDCGLLLDPILSEELMYSDSNLKIEVGASMNCWRVLTDRSLNNVENQPLTRSNTPIVNKKKSLLSKFNKSIYHIRKIFRTGKSQQ